MKKITVTVLCLVLVSSLSDVSDASDWDKAGKALTIIEGVRVLTGGKVDLIGNITGINSQPKYVHKKRRGRSHYVYYKEQRRDCHDRIWVPHYKHVRKYIPKHEEYDDKYGLIIIEGHYIRYKVENGGHWETKYYCN